MNVQDELLDIERGFWTGGPDAYRRNVDDECLLAFGKAGVSSREEIAGSAGGQRWKDPDIQLRGFLQPTDDVALLTYEAKTEREGSPYHALVSSGYVRRDDGWKLTFHQQTPMS
jgi:hypothetical protein